MTETHYRAYTLSRPGDYIRVEIGEPLPDGYTDQPPPDPDEGHRVAWDGQGWAQVPIPVPAEPEPEPEPSTDPADWPLTARQLRLGLVRHDVPLPTIEAAIDGITDPAERDEALIYWEYSTTIRWDHPMTQALMALVGISPEQGAAMWMAAKDYET